MRSVAHKVGDSLTWAFTLNIFSWEWRQQQRRPWQSKYIIKTKTMVLQVQVLYDEDDVHYAHDSFTETGGNFTRDI